MKGWTQKDFRWFVYTLFLMGLLWILHSWWYGEEDSLYFDQIKIECPNQEEECAYG